LLFFLIPGHRFVCISFVPRRDHIALEEILLQYLISMLRELEIASNLSLSTYRSRYTAHKFFLCDSRTVIGALLNRMKSSFLDVARGLADREYAISGKREGRLYEMKSGVAKKTCDVNHSSHLKRWLTSTICAIRIEVSQTSPLICGS